MPFTKHIIEPINISQCPLPAGEPNELECLSNLTLANVIRQLSSLGQHAGRIFDELKSDASKLSTRTQQMHQRIENLKSKCSLLDIQSEEVTLADLQTKKQFKSSVKIDQQVVSRKTMPDAMRLMYNNADPPPSLDKLNHYRTDGKDCMKFYTDPDFFFNIWCNELFKDNETRKIEKKRRKVKNEKMPTLQQQNLKSPVLLNSIDSNNHNGVSLPMLMQQKQMNQYEDAAFYQQQLILLNKAKQQQQYMSTNNPLLNKHYFSQQQQHDIMQNYDDYDSHLVIPTHNILQQTNNLNGLNINNYEIYTDSNKLNNMKNGSRNMPQSHSPALSKQHSNGNNNNNERPILPPPPIPNNQMSDLQQIQQQMIKKKLTDITISNKNSNGVHHYEEKSQQNIMESSTSDLPPPPSPPTVYGSNMHQNGNSVYSYAQQRQHNNHQQQINKFNEKSMTDSHEFDMPLPPPPIELQQNDYNHQQISPPLPPPMLSMQHQSVSANNVNNSLPPPPPLPPLVESDTASSGSSISINNSNQMKINSSISDELKPARNCYLDDISKRRFQLKSTALKDNNSLTDESRLKETSNSENRDTIQPFVNNSDVAAIIDFCRKFRPHVRDSSDEDEENSDWDE